MIHRGILSAYITLALSLSIAGVSGSGSRGGALHYAPGGGLSGKGVIACNFIDSARDSINSLREGVNGITRFLETVTGTVKILASLAGIRAVVLLLAVMVLSSIINLLGVPRGKLLFLLSLACADYLWVTWHGSFGTLDGAFIWSVAKTNLIVLTPLVVVALAGRFLPVVAAGAGNLMGRLFPSERGRSKNETARLFDRYKALQGDFERSFFRDIMAAGDGPVKVSGETRRLAGETARLSVALVEDRGGKKDGA